MSSLIPWLCLVLAAAAPAKAPVSADAILERVGRIYGTMSSYHFEGTIHMTVKPKDQDEQTMDMPFILAAASAGRVHTEMTNPMLGVVSISDGQHSWLYVPRLKQYSEKTAAPIADRGGEAGSVRALTGGTPVARYVDIHQHARNAKLLREESVPFDGKPVACYVVQVESQSSTSDMKRSPSTLWVAKRSSLVLKDDQVIDLASSPGGPVSMHQVTDYRIAEVNQPVADQMFTFVPPKEAQRVDQITVPGMKPPDLEGHPAKDFTLADLSGQSRSLSSWRGKVVLLDFWASWCGPCRQEMPTIAKLHRELASKGLAVVALNVGESAAVAGRFAKQGHYDFDILLDPEGHTADAYAASGLPTVVVIDRQGNISSRFVGLRSEQELRAALEKAGLE